MDEAELKKQLFELVKEKAIIKGERKLASGKTSNYYFDGKQVTLDPQGLFLTAKLILAQLQGSNIDAIGGPTLGADPIAAAVCLLSSQSGHPVKAFIARKEAKDHGTQKMIEGPELKEGDRVVVVEDVITTGGSVLKVLKALDAMKVKIVRTVCLVDRNEGARETLGPYNYMPIFTVDEFGL